MPVASNARRSEARVLAGTNSPLSFSGDQTSLLTLGASGEVTLSVRYGLQFCTQYHWVVGVSGVVRSHLHDGLISEVIVLPENIKHRIIEHLDRVTDGERVIGGED